MDRFLALANSRFMDTHSFPPSHLRSRNPYACKDHCSFGFDFHSHSRIGNYLLIQVSKMTDQIESTVNIVKKQTNAIKEQVQEIAKQKGLIE